MKKIILSSINCRHTHSSIALGYIKVFCESQNSSIELCIQEFDLSNSNEQIISSLILEKPQILAFSCYIWSINRIIEVTSALKTVFSDCIIILGGPEVSFNSKEVLASAPWIDFIIRGEGEFIFKELLDSLILETSFENIRGLTFKKNSEIIVNQPAQLITNLDLLPSPFQKGIFGTGQGFTYYEGSRGCHSKCSYCLSSVSGAVRNFSIERIKSDLDWFFESDYKQIRFTDRTFNSEPERAIEILEYILKNNKKNINFHFEIQADYLTDEIMQVFKKAPKEGFHLEIGVQSTNPDALQAIKRNFNLKKMKYFVTELINKTNCHIHLDLLGGLPKEDFHSFKRGLNELISLNAHDIQINMIKVLRGTPLHKTMSDDIQSMPVPPYTVLFTKWLSAKEAIKIFDIGRLIDGFYNSGRFRLSIKQISELIFKGSFSDMLEALANYWRKNNLDLFNFSPAICHTELRNFINTLASHTETISILEDIIEHELHLIQKVPLETSFSRVPVEVRKIKTRYRVESGYKAFWYTTNLNMLLKPNNGVVTGLFPHVYKYQTDLSQAPYTSLIDFPTEKAFLIASLQSRLSIDETSQLWEKLYPKQPIPNFLLLLDKLLSDELIYDSRK